MQTASPRSYSGIASLTGRDPIGAALTIGTKAPSGNPTNADRFYFKLPVATSVSDKLVKPEHPAFAQFNAAPAEQRQVIRGNLVHATQAECFEYALAAQVLGRAWEAWPGAHPNRLPVCRGDGHTATRLYGIGPDGAEDWREIECPDRACQFRLGKGPKACRPAMRFLFRPRWRDGSFLPTPLTLLASHSWASAANFLGFFEYVAAQARQLGLESHSLYGLPFVMTLAMKTKPSEKARFPVVSVSPDGDLIAFLLAQRRDVAQIGGGAVAALPATLQDPDVADPIRAADDFAEIEPGLHKPANPAREDAPGSTISLEPDRDPALLSSGAVARIRAAAEVRGIDAATLHSLVGGPLDDAPAGCELEILRAIATYRSAR